MPGSLEVFQTHILRAVSCYFRTVIMKDPVYLSILLSSLLTVKIYALPKIVKLKVKHET